MIEVTDEKILTNEKTSFLYIYTPFCGTCQLAGKMLNAIELMDENQTFYAMNASLFPNYMQEHKIESVPCLAIIVEGSIREKIYAFRSVPYLLDKIHAYK